MDDKRANLDTSINNFFLRAGLTPQDLTDSYAFIKELYPGEPITPASCQGYCSMTVFVGDALVVQFRPSVYKIDLQAVRAARAVYGSCVPDSKHIGTLPSSNLLVYSMNRIEGISFEDFRSREGSSASSAAQSTVHRRRLCKDFAGFLAKAWHCEIIDIPLGIVGSSLVSRLKSLVTDLPTRFQSTARTVLGKLNRIEALPWVLTHGDVMTANIMVDPSSCDLVGFVDWAEAERLPFGVCLYGLEEILGEMTPSGFCYHPNAEALRSDFWVELQKNIPELRQSQVLEAVKLARDLGVLLWHGIAFDNGAIDRVVQEGRDIEEIHRLDAFLDLYGQKLNSKDLADTSPSTFCTTSIAQLHISFPPGSQKKHIPTQ